MGTRAAAITGFMGRKCNECMRNTGWKHAARFRNLQLVRAHIPFVWLLGDSVSYCFAKNGIHSEGPKIQSMPVSASTKLFSLFILSMLPYISHGMRQNNISRTIRPSLFTIPCMPLEIYLTDIYIATWFRTTHQQFNNITEAKAIQSGMTLILVSWMTWVVGQLWPQGWW